MDLLWRVWDKYNAVSNASSRPPLVADDFNAPKNLTCLACVRHQLGPHAEDPPQYYGTSRPPVNIRGSQSEVVVVPRYSREESLWGYEPLCNTLKLGDGSLYFRQPCAGSFEVDFLLAPPQTAETRRSMIDRPPGNSHACAD